MNLPKLLLLFALLFSGLAVTPAAELAGKWKSEFDSQIGPQKYAFEFKAEGNHFTGTAGYDHSMGKGNSVLSEIKLSGDNVSFIERLNLNNMELTVTYTGKISGDEMKLTRVVGDIATEQIVAKRLEETAAKAAPAK